MAAPTACARPMPISRACSTTISWITCARARRLTPPAINRAQWRPTRPRTITSRPVTTCISVLANTENFVNEGLRMQASANETAHVGQGQIPLERAQAERARAQSEYLGGRNATQLAVAETRTQAQAFGHLHPNIQAFYTNNLKDLPDSGDAEDVAGQLE